MKNNNDDQDDNEDTTLLPPRPITTNLFYWLQNSMTKWPPPGNRLGLIKSALKMLADIMCIRYTYSAQVTSVIDKSVPDLEAL